MANRTTLLLVVFLAGTASCVHAQSQAKPRAIRVFVALADNQHQGIIPVPAALGNGDDPLHNLYWGAAFGVRTFFRNSADWKEALRVQKPYKGVLERIAFQHRTQNVFLVADAYKGSEIKQAMTDFFRTAAGIDVHAGEPKECTIGGVVWCPPEDADLVVYVGHDGLMDFSFAAGFSESNRNKPTRHHFGVRKQIFLQGPSPQDRRATAPLDYGLDGA